MFLTLAGGSEIFSLRIGFVESLFHPSTEFVGPLIAVGKSCIHRKLGWPFAEFLETPRLRREFAPRSLCLLLEGLQRSQRRGC